MARDELDMEFGNNPNDIDDEVEAEAEESDEQDETAPAIPARGKPTRESKRGAGPVDNSRIPLEGVAPWRTPTVSASIGIWNCSAF